MAIPIKKASSADSLAMISNVLLTAFIIFMLYFARELLVPLALAALLTFLLGPLVTRLQRWLGNVGAVLLVVATLLGATGVAGWVLTRQAMDLANQLPAYEENIRTKLRSIRLPGDGVIDRLSRTVEDLKKDLPGSEEQEAEGIAGLGRDEEKVMPVEIVSDERLRIAQIILGPLGTAGLVLLLLIFMLLQRDDLRNRIIRLVGQGRISATSRAMDDAGSRVSKYLVMLLVVNVTYGIPVAIGLYFIGVPNAILWGALATVLRFIPYVGPWIAAAFPILLSLAVSPDWLAPILTVSLFIVLELVSNNVMEPLLYGSSTGVTPIALIVAALVWTWLWGPVGLVLATPLTVCLVVMGRHIPRLAFLSIVLSDEEALTPAEECYHRLHRSGGHEGLDFVENYLKSNSTDTLFDSVLVPVVVAAEADQRAGLLETEQLASIHESLGEILHDLDVRLDVAAPPDQEQGATAPRVCCVPAKAFRDELAAEMLVQLLRHRGYAARDASSTMVSGEMVGWVREMNPDIVFISAVAPTSLVHLRYICSKLRTNFPDMKIIAGLLGHPETNAEVARQVRESGANDFVTSLSAAADRVTVHEPLPNPADPEVDAPVVQCA